jgi:signal transduction histidine kinase/CheY-like chemotaxis protein
MSLDSRGADCPATAFAQLFSTFVAAAGLAVAVAIAYFFAARLGLALLTKPDGVAVFWPAAGIASGVLIGLGSAARVPVIAGVIIATVVANLLGDRSIWSAIVFAVCNAVEAVLVASLIGRFFGSSFCLDRLQNVLGLIVATIVGTAVSGVGGTAGFHLFHGSTASVLTVWQHWFTSDALGIITVAPLLIGLFSVAHGPPPAKEVAEGGVALVAIAALSGLAIYLPNEPWVVEVTVAALFPLLVWISARCSPVFAAIAAFILAFTIVCATTFGVGIFDASHFSPTERVLSAQTAVLALSFCALVLAALFAERRQHVATLLAGQQKLQSALKAVAQANRAKSSFLAAASHDLRQPLQTLNLLQKALKQGAKDTETHSLVAEMEHSVGVMNGMLISLLDIDRLESGALRPSICDLPISEIFDSIVMDFRQPIVEKGLELRLVRSRMIVQSDRRMLEEMIRNLLSNAVRYTEQGQILMGCRRAGDRARIEIWDSGVGIMGEHLPRIFEEYYRIPNNTQPSGFGLGLAIVQRLGQILNHHVDVRSTPGKGSGFFIEVPLVNSEANATRVVIIPPEIANLPCAILVIEDDSSVRKSLDSLFRSVGSEVISVATGKDALARITETGIRPDVVVSDYNLPGKMNGIATIIALRKALAWKIPAIVLTGDTSREATEEIAQQDVGIAVKPINGDDLLQLVMAFHAPSSRRYLS